MDDKKIKILMVDDESDFTQPMAFWFESEGYAVSVASNGEDAIRLVKEASPDILFMDLNMPVMDGVEALKKIREFNKELPVIIISAYLGDRERMTELNAYGISGVFYKGADFEEGLSLLKSALRTHKKLKR